MMKRVMTATLLVILAVSASWRPMQQQKFWILRTAAATLFEPVIAAQSADAAVGTPSEAAVRDASEDRKVPHQARNGIIARSCETSL